MSYNSTHESPQLGTPTTDTLDIRKQIRSYTKKELTVIDSSRIINATNAEDWSNTVIEALIHNLIFDFSAYGGFGNPDTNIVKSVIASGNGKKLWVKLLGIKMSVLMATLDSLPISDLHKDRIRKIDSDFRNIFKPRKND